MDYGWIVVNVALPVLLPLVLLGIGKLVKSDVSLIDTVKDGQLCWFGLTLACSMGYDVGRNDASVHRWSGDLWTLGALASFGFFCGLLAVLGSLIPVRPDALGMRRYQVLLASILFDFAIVGVSIVAHDKLAGFAS